MAEGNPDTSPAETKVYDLQSILSSPERDFLIRNNGEQVKIDVLKGKAVGLYFSASWCGPCQRFTPCLVEVYKELLPRGDFEVIFLSADEDDKSFDGYFSKMPWLAIPFSDSGTRERLDELFSVRGIPNLVILDENGKILTEDGVDLIQEYGVEGYPFSAEWIKEIKEQEELRRREQSLKSILCSHSRDYAVAADGKKVPITELEGKIVGLYFSLSTFPSSLSFTSKLIQVYQKLKDIGENFEIIMLPLDDEEENLALEDFPWLSLPIGDKIIQKLVRYFELDTLPTLVIIGPDGKTLQSNVAEAIEDHGIQAYPFTAEKFAELEEIEKAKREAQTLESILILGDQDFVIGEGGVQVPVSDLVGKNILLYFSAQWCPPCRAFLPKLVEAYKNIKAKDDAFEVIFVSSDRDEDSFTEFFSKMPWLAIPFGDPRKESLARVFKVQGIPMLVAIGPTGKTVTTDARNLLMYHGAEAYPFTEERMKEIETQLDEMRKGWPEKIKNALHEEHELVLAKRQVYTCDGCDDEGQGWSFYCDECDFDLHPRCALEGKQEMEDKTEGGADGIPEDGLICDGDVCRRV